MGSKGFRLHTFAFTLLPASIGLSCCARRIAQGAAFITTASQEMRLNENRAGFLCVFVHV
jgi:hypothetical protein